MDNEINEYKKLNLIEKISLWYGIINTLGIIIALYYAIKNDDPFIIMIFIPTTLLMFFIGVFASVSRTDYKIGEK